MQSLVEKLKGLARTGPSRGVGTAGGGNVKITFSVPTPVAAEPQPDLTQLQIGRRDADHDDPIQYLAACRKEARALSRCTLMPSRRLQVTEEFAVHFVLIAGTHIRTYSEDGGIPDSDRRKGLLDTTAAVLGYLIDSYKVAFRKLYTELPGTHESRREMTRSAFRILELTKLMQRVMGLRYVVLPGSSWLTVNTVFHAMRALRRAERKVVPLETGLLEDHNVSRLTLSEMYLAIQLVARFDILKWPTELHHFLFSYGKSVSFLGALIDDNRGPLPRHVSAAYCYDTNAARTTRPEADAPLGPSVLIDWGQLIHKITSDMIVFFGSTTGTDLTYFQKRLAKMTYNNRLALVQLQFESFTNERQHAAIDSGGGEACDMRIFIGFRSVYQLLQNIHISKQGVGTRLDDELAKRSAVFADDDVATVESVWFLQFEDKDTLRLKTQESKFTTSMRIGMMAAYGVGSDGIARPRFGVIARILRPSPESVIVDVVKHGEYVEPVVISQDAAALDSADRTAGLVLGAIIVKSAQGETKLLLPPLSTLSESAALAMKRLNSREAIKLGKLQTVTRDFFQFRLA